MSMLVERETSAGSEGARRATGAGDPAGRDAAGVEDPEVSEQAKRRRFIGRHLLACEQQVEQSQHIQGVTTRLSRVKARSSSAIRSSKSMKTSLG